MQGEQVEFRPHCPPPPDPQLGPQGPPRVGRPPLPVGAGSVPAGSGDTWCLSFFLELFRGLTCAGAAGPGLKCSWPPPATSLSQGQLPKPGCAASPARLSPAEPHLLCQAEASGLFLESGPSPDTGSRLRRLRTPPTVTAAELRRYGHSLLMWSPQDSVASPRQCGHPLDLHFPPRLLPPGPSPSP